MKRLIFCVLILGGVKTWGEPTCFRTSECDVGEICQAVRGSAMGICRTIQSAQTSASFKTWGLREQEENGWTKPDAGFDDDGGDE